jgi:hypothetical protein
MGYGSDRRESLSSKAERANLFQILDGKELARGMPLKSGSGVGLVHASPVVAHGNRLDTSALDKDDDLSSTRIERVLDKLLHHRSRTLNDLTRSNLVGKMLGQNCDSAI